MWQIIIIALLCAIITLYLKSVGSEFYIFTLIGSGIIIFIFIVSYLSTIYEFINYLITLSGIDKEYYLIILKVTAVAYLVEFATDVINDMGIGGLANKLIFAGKIIILYLSMPIFYAIIRLLTELIR
ncbi:MAG: hypothetical protein IKB67_01000 [Clostridia bacterium]|nr:hypothetical protein [Clostridia bacterium]